MISNSDLQGTWQLESWTIGYSDRDDFTYPYGEDPQGMLIYSSDGWMSAAINRPQRDPFPGDVSIRKLPDEQKAQAYSSYFHYSGRYLVKEGDVIHYVTQSRRASISSILPTHSLMFATMWRCSSSESGTLIL